MAEYIERGKLNDTLDELCVNDSLYNALQCIPAADVAPVIHGKWKYVAGMNSKCSECGHYFPVTEFEKRPFDINYCPHCGAKMGGKDGE